MLMLNVRDGATGVCRKLGIYMYSNLLVTQLIITENTRSYVVRSFSP